MTVSESPFDTLLVLMVPTNDIKKHIMTLVDNNVNIIDIHTFKDLRETGGGGANQTLLILGNNNPLDESIYVLENHFIITLFLALLIGGHWYLNEPLRS
jgi:hypothetical protein